MKSVVMYKLRVAQYLASTPGSLGGRGKRVWYTLSAYASKFTQTSP